MFVFVYTHSVSWSSLHTNRKADLCLQCKNDKDHSAAHALVLKLAWKCEAGDGWDIGMKEWGMAGMASLKLHCCLSTLHDVRWSCLGGHHEMGKNCVQENWSVSLEPRCCSWKVGTRRDEESVTDIIKRMDAKPIYVCNVKVTKITLQRRIVRKWCSEDCLRLLVSFNVWTVRNCTTDPWWDAMRYKIQSDPWPSDPKTRPGLRNLCCFIVLGVKICCVALFIFFGTRRNKWDCTDCTTKSYIKRNCLMTSATACPG